MVRNKKGLSIVVTSLIIILLVLVAIGIVWLVVRSVVEEGTEQISVSTKCLEIDVRATAVDCTDPSNCSVTLERGSGGEEIGGVKLVFKNTTDASNVIDVPGDIEALASITRENINSTITAPNKIEVTAYLSVEGKEKLCSQTNPFSF